jgi:hypothetical protein
MLVLLDLVERERVKPIFWILSSGVAHSDSARRPQTAVGLYRQRAAEGGDVVLQPQLCALQPTDYNCVQVGAAIFVSQIALQRSMTSAKRPDVILQRYDRPPVEAGIYCP